jgi:hypothetical protein
VCGENLCEDVVCKDDEACTDDTCDYVDGTCNFPPTVCDDGDLCTEDRCNPADGCDFTTQAEDGTFCYSEDLPHQMAGVCKAGVCVYPCDPTSEEVLRCPSPFSSGYVCCPGEKECTDPILCPFE